MDSKNYTLKGGERLSNVTFKPFDDLIQNSGLKLDAVASRMNVSRQRLYEFRKDPACMSVDQLKKMADILGVEFADMYNLREAYQNETKEDL